MKLTLKIKLLPNNEQAILLFETIKEANTVCNAISDVAWQEKIFNNFKLHHRVYHLYKTTFKLSSQMLIRQIAKVADSYRKDKKVKRIFNPLGSIAYDSRIMTYKPNNIVSLWCINGRQKISFICHNSKYIPYIKGEADLVYKNGKFYLFQTIDVKEEDVTDVEDFIGVDFGLTDLVVTSDGIKYSSEWINTYRENIQKVRSSIQAKADTSKRSTKRNARKLNKRLNGKEKTTSNLINHTISKAIVSYAKEQGKGISIENLTNIVSTSKRRSKKFIKKLSKWNFRELRNKIEYKAALSGVKLIVINPAYTSQTCNCCKHIGKRTNKVFKCTNKNCGVDIIDADFNAAKNISSLGRAINHVEKSNNMCCSIEHIYSGLKSVNAFY